MPGYRPRIDFIAGTRNAQCFLQDPSFIYRCENLQAALGAQGFAVGLHHISDYRLPEDLSAVVLHRPRKSWRLRWLVRRLRARQIPIVADVDDLIFDRNLAQFSPAVVGGMHGLRKARRLFASHHSALGWADKILVSTQALAEHIGRVYPAMPVGIAHNSVHSSWLSAKPLEQPDSVKKTISYCPGTRSHDLDFRLVERSVLRFLQRHPQVDLKITGPLKHNLSCLGAQVEHQPKAPFERYAEVVQGSWLNLSPLENTPFNACKSALKILEAGYWNIPTLCSPNRDAGRFSGAGAIVADDGNTWDQHLELLMQPAIYSQHVKALRSKVLALAHPAIQAQVLLKLLALPEPALSVA